MPHTNRKKQSSTAKEKTHRSKLVRTKRQQIEDDDGWTHVIDIPRGVQVKVEEGQLLHAGDFERDGISYVERTVDEMKADLEYYQKQWESNEACAVLKDKLVGDSRLKVGDVVCLGLGSMQSARREGRRASFIQLAALRTIMEILAGEEKLQCIFQDPQFMDHDKELLASLGYTVVDDPLAFGRITQKSLVYAIHCYAQVYKLVAEGPRPALMIGTDVENFKKFNLLESTEIIMKSLENMVKDCEVIDFPQVRHDFSDTKIYWRKD